MGHLRYGYLVILLAAFSSSGGSFGAGSGHPTSAGRRGAPVFDTSTLFKAGDQGYKCYRIPALLTTKSGVILAFCEA